MDRRFDPRVEAATYFCVAEATRAFEYPVAVDLSVHGDQLAPDGQWRRWRRPAP